MLNYPTPAVGLWRLTEWGFDATALLNWTTQVLDLGVTVFDSADIYGDYTVDRRFGDALALEATLRDRLTIVTKCGIMLLSGNRPGNRIKHYDLSAAHIVASTEQSLRDLRTDRIDLLLLHRPDLLLNADEAAEALVKLKREGKILAAGVSNFAPNQLELLASRLPFPLATNQVQFSPLHLAPLQDGSFDQCQRLAISPMAWSPFAQGAIFNGQYDTDYRLRATLEALREPLGASHIDQVVLAWILRHPARIVPILGTRRIDAIKRAVESTRLTMDRQQWYQVLAAVQGHEVP